MGRALSSTAGRQDSGSSRLLQDEAMLPWALMPIGNGRLARRFLLTYSVGLGASCERQGLSTEKCPVHPDVEAARTQLPG